MDSYFIREEKRLRVFENKVLRDEETGEWRNIIKINKSPRLRWAGHVAQMEDERGARRILEGKPEGKRPVGRPRIGYTGDDWKTLAQDRDVR
ncbi:hypothetical protein C0J52_27443 [Blattella germanica]|nr:hypothetical protein C0J52_27443 [Blattella germanica]